MAQHDYIISNQTFPNTRADLNNVLQAIATNNSGTSAPTTLYAGQFWLDTNTPSSTTWTLYIHDGSDNIEFAQIDTSANTVNFIDSALASDVVINTSGAITTTGAFTSKGIDDNADATAITIDSSESLGLGTTSPFNSRAGSFTISNEAPTIYMEDTNSSGSGVGQILYSNGDLAYSTGTRNGTGTSNSTEHFRIKNDGNVGIGTSAPQSLLHVVGSSTSSQIIIENTDAGASAAPDLFLFRNSSSPADNDSLGNIEFRGKNDNTEDTRYAINNAKIIDASDGTEDGQIEWQILNNGGFQKVLTMNPTEIVINEDSGDTNFRVESNGNANMLFVDGGNDRVGIGTSSPSSIIHAETTTGAELILSRNDTSIAVDDLIGGIQFKANDASSSPDPQICGIKAISTGATNTNPRLDFFAGESNYSANTPNMVIDSSGNVLVGKTASMYFVDGVTLHSGGGQFSNTDDFEMIVNRNGSDGTLVEFRHATVLEGSISVSGTTVSYNGFTGTHWSRFTDNSTPTILKGTVLETLDEMCDWYNLEFDVTTTTQDEDGNDVTNTITEKIPHVLTDTQSVGDIITYNHEGTDYQTTIVKETDIKHMKSKVSDNSDAKNVYGVFVAYDEDGEGYNDFYVASVGSFVVRIKQGETVAKGDLLQSNGDGTAKVQTDDNIKSSSFAKVLSTTVIETYDDGSYIVPCSLMC